MKQRIEDGGLITMIEFDFKVNNSFLKLAWSRRPITIPKRLYERLRGTSIEGGVTNIRIICPDGSSLDGSIHYGSNNTTYYYQIKIRGHENDSLAQLNQGDLIKVKIYENENKIELVGLTHRIL